MPNIWLGKSCREPSYCYSHTDLLTRLSHIITEKSVVITAISPRRIQNKNRSSKEVEHSINELKSSLNSLINLIKSKRSKLVILGGLPQINCTEGQDFGTIYNIGGPLKVNECSPSRDCYSTEFSFTNLIEGIQKKNHQNVALINIFDQY